MHLRLIFTFAENLSYQFWCNQYLMVFRLYLTSNFFDVKLITSAIYAIVTALVLHLLNLWNDKQTQLSNQLHAIFSSISSGNTELCPVMTLSSNLYTQWGYTTFFSSYFVARKQVSSWIFELNLLKTSFLMENQSVVKTYSQIKWDYSIISQNLLHQLKFNKWK